MYYARMQSMAGPLVLGASDTGLALLEFDRERFPSTKWARELQWSESPQMLRAFVRELEEYFAGERKRFDFKLDLRGTEFQLKCWRALLAIPYGKTQSYAEVARAVGCPQGFRAVGMANHDNPIAIVVPCHRVITSSGGLGGYGGGLDVKAKLLALEGVSVRLAATKVARTAAGQMTLV